MVSAVPMPQKSQAPTRSDAAAENMRGKRLRSAAMSAAVMSVRKARLADRAVAEPFAQHVDHHDRRHDDEKNRPGVGEIQKLDGGKEVVPDAARADESHDRRAAHVELEAPERIRQVVRHHLRQDREAHLLEPVAAGGAMPSMGSVLMFSFTSAKSFPWAPIVWTVMARIPASGPMPNAMMKSSAQTISGTVRAISSTRRVTQ